MWDIGRFYKLLLTFFVRCLTPIVSANSCKAILLLLLRNGTWGGSPDRGGSDGSGGGGGGGGGGGAGGALSFSSASLSFASAWSARSVADWSSDSTSCRRSSKISIWGFWSLTWSSRRSWNID